MDSKSTQPVILVVEDDQMIAVVLNHILARSGFQVCLAADGKQATALLDAMAPPALVLLDVMLPYVDGFELLQRMRSKPKWSDVPIIMLTSKVVEAQIVRALETGANDYVAKPFRPEELLARVRRLIRDAK